MSEKARKGIVYGALFLAVVWGIYNFLPKSNSTQMTQNAAVASAPQPGLAMAAPIEKTINVAEMKVKSWGDDPFRSIEKKTGEIVSSNVNRWRLSGIVYNSSKPLAIINGKSVSIGQQIGSATVIEIGPKTVILDNAGARVTLRVSKG
jgi:hypothetical protein